MKPEVGLIFEESHPRWPDVVYTYQVTSTDVKNDCHGTIELSTLKIVEPRTKDKHFELHENIVIVEELWFDEKWTRRKFKILNNED